MDISLVIGWIGRVDLVWINRVEVASRRRANATKRKPEIISGFLYIDSKTNFMEW